MAVAPMGIGLFKVKRWSVMLAGSGAKAERAPECAAVVTTVQPGVPVELNELSVPLSKPSTSGWPQTVGVGVAVPVEVTVKVGVRVFVAVGGVPLGVGVGLPPGVVAS